MSEPATELPIPFRPGPDRCITCGEKLELNRDPVPLDSEFCDECLGISRDLTVWDDLGEVGA